MSKRRGLWKHGRWRGAMVLWMAAVLGACSAGGVWDVVEDRPGEWADGTRRIGPVEPTQADEQLAPTTGVLSLSIEQAVLVALRYNRALDAQQLSPVIAGQFEQLERAVYDPVVDASGRYSRARQRQVFAATGDAFDLTAEGGSVAGGIGRRLPTGTRVGVDVGHEYSGSDRAPDQHTARVGLTATQALLQGLSPEANLASIRQARLDGLISEFELRGFTETLVASVEQAYWDVVLARREIEIFERSLEVAQQQQAEVERRVEVGVLAEVELAASRAEVALRREALINARANHEARRLVLLRLLNPPGPMMWDRVLELDEVPGELDVELDAVESHVALGERLRTDLNEARLRLERGRLEVVQTRNGLLPRLDLFVSLGKTGFADSFGSAWGDLDGSGYDATVGVNFEQPLGNRAARAQDTIARVSRQQAAEALGNIQQLVQFDVRRAHLEVGRTREQIAATVATRELREQTLGVEEEKFRVGTSTALLVAQAQRDLLESRIAEVRALVQHRQALIDLYRLEGSLLLRRGIGAPGGGQEGFLLGASVQDATQ